MKPSIAVAMIVFAASGLAASAQIIGPPVPVTQDQWSETTTKLRRAEKDIQFLEDQVVSLQEQVDDLRRRIR